MLVFTRKLDESFIIGKYIVVKVLGRDCHGNIQFGIEGYANNQNLTLIEERPPIIAKQDIVDVGQDEVVEGHL